MRLVLAAALTLAACTPPPVALPAAPTDNEAALYLTDGAGAELTAVDPLTLGDRSTRLSVPPPKLSLVRTGPQRSVVASEDGRTLAVSNYAAAGSSGISIIDVRSGKQRANVVPEVPVIVDGLNADGSHIFARGWPPRELTAERLVLDAANGKVLRLEPAFALPGDLVAYATDAQGRRLYSLLAASDPKATGPRAVELSAWDLRTGTGLWRLGIPSLLAGEWLTGRRVPDSASSSSAGVEVRARLVPGIALSPDGRRLAVVRAPECCGAARTVWLVDSDGRLLSERTYQGATSFLERIFGSSIAFAKSLDESSVVSASFGADGRVLYVRGDRTRVDDQWETERQYLGMVAVDLEASRVIGSDVKMEQWWYENLIHWSYPSPDGKWLYVLVERTGHADPKGYVLRRLDATTLAVLAERRFDAYRYGYMLGGR